MQESILDYFKPMYQDLYTLEAWTLWICVRILYFGYYICLYGGFLFFLLIIIVPVFSFMGWIRGGIRIKFSKKKHRHKHKSQLEKQNRDNYINFLEKANQKNKRKNEYFRKTTR